MQTNNGRSSLRRPAADGPRRRVGVHDADVDAAVARDVLKRVWRRNDDAADGPATVHGAVRRDQCLGKITKLTHSRDSRQIILRNYHSLLSLLFVLNVMKGDFYRAIIFM